MLSEVMIIDNRKRLRVLSSIEANKRKFFKDNDYEFKSDSRVEHPIESQPIGIKLKELVRYRPSLANGKNYRFCSLRGIATYQGLLNKVQFSNFIVRKMNENLQEYMITYNSCSKTGNKYTHLYFRCYKPFKCASSSSLEYRDLKPSLLRVLASSGDGEDNIIVKYMLENDNFPMTNITDIILSSNYVPKFNDSVQLNSILEVQEPISINDCNIDDLMFPIF